jgi:hypothetical protein
VTEDLSGRTTDALWRLLPFAVFAALFAVSYGRWVIPFQDSGREMNVPMRLLSGEVLYRDVGYFFGPIPPYLDALALGLLGKSLDVLVALRVGVGILGLEALRRLFSRVAGDARLGAFLSAAVAATCLFGLGGAWPFPYSVAALDGFVALLWALEVALGAKGWLDSLVAAALSGLAAGTKVEMLPAAILGVGVALALRRPRREAVAATALAGLFGCAAYAVPVAALGREVLRSHGFLVGFPAPETWQRLYLKHVLLGGYEPEAFRAGGFLDVAFPSAIFLGAMLLLFSRISMRPGRAGTLAVVAGAASALVPGNEELHLLLPAAGVLLAADALRAWKERAGSIDARLAARLAVGAAMLPLLLRQPLFLRNPIYSAFTAPLALGLSLAWFVGRFRVPVAAAGFLAGLTLAQAHDRWVEFRGRPWARVELPGARLFLPPDEAAFVKEAAATIGRLSRPGGFAAVFPEPGFLLFVTGRRNPFVDEQFQPGHQDARGEDEMVEALGKRPPEVVLLTNRRFGEFGEGILYGRGVLDRFFPALMSRYAPAGKIGGPRREETWESRVTDAVVLEPRTVSGDVAR